MARKVSPLVNGPLLRPSKKTVWSENRAFSTTIEFPVADGLTDARLLAVQEWEKSTSDDDDDDDDDNNNDKGSDTEDDDDGDDEEEEEYVEEDDGTQ